MMDLVETIAELDSQPDLHAARLLVLISAFSDQSRKTRWRDSQSSPSSTFSFVTLSC